MEESVIQQFSAALRKGWTTTSASSSIGREGQDTGINAKGHAEGNTSPSPVSPRHDYISPGLVQINADYAFPTIRAGDGETKAWAGLRETIPHTWYGDTLHPGVPLLNRDELHLLYNIALKFRGKRALAIGSGSGWTAAHLALAGVVLDVVHPQLDQADWVDSIQASLQTVGVQDAVTLIAGTPPQKVEELAAQEQRRWSLMVMDGDYGAPNPLRNAIACDQVADSTALILFHNLVSADVAQGLDYLRQRGWRTLIYPTQQIIGIAWRGDIEPVPHAPDPTVLWSLPPHLTYYSLSSAPPPSPVPTSPNLSSSTPSPPQSSPPQVPLPSLATALSQTAPHFTYRGIPLHHDPFNLAVYALLLATVKPRSVIELGSRWNSSAGWLGDLLRALGNEGQVYCSDFLDAPPPSPTNVIYRPGGSSLADSFPAPFWETLPRPVVVLLGGDPGYDRMKDCLEFLHGFLQSQDYLIMAGNSAVTQLPSKQGIHALSEFLSATPGGYERDESFHLIALGTEASPICLKKLGDTPRRAETPPPSPIPDLIASPEPAQTSPTPPSSVGLEDEESSSPTPSAPVDLEESSLPEELSDLTGVDNEAAAEPDLPLAADDSSGEPEDLPEEPLSEEEAIAQEILNAAGLDSVPQLEALVAEYQQAGDAPLAIGQLRRVRQRIADQWLSLLSDELPTLYAGSLGVMHRLIVNSGLRDEPLTAAERSFREETAAYLEEGLEIPGAIQHLLAAMLYFYPHQLPAVPDWGNLPTWLVGDYQQFLSAE